MKFTHMVSYGNPKTGLNSYEDFQAAFEKYIKIVEKHGMKVVFWGHPFGVSEAMICVLKGDMDKYTKLMESTEASDAQPWTNARTQFVITH